MDPVTVIVSALSAGVAAGAKDMASAAVRDAYEGLKRRLSGHLTGGSAGSVALEKYEDKPAVWEGPLRDELQTTGAVQDVAVLEAAQQLLTLIDPQGSEAGKYQLDLRGAQVGMVGDHNTGSFIFTAPPKPPAE